MLGLILYISMKYFILCIFISYNTILFSQGFSLEIPSNFENFAQDITETPNGDYIVIQTFSDKQYSLKSYLQLVKISHTGDVLLTKDIVPISPFRFSFRGQFVKDYPTDLGYFFHATLNDSLYEQVEKQPYFARFDDNLNMLWDTVWGEIGIKELAFEETVVGDTIFFLGGISSGNNGSGNPVPFDFTPTISKVDLFGNIHENVVLNSMTNKLIGNENIINSGNNLFLHDISLDSFIQVDLNNLNNVKRRPFIPFSGIGKNGFTCKITENKYLLAGRDGYISFQYNPPKFFGRICLLVIDSSGTTVDTIRLGQTDQFSTETSFRTIDVHDENHIFVAGYDPTTPNFPTSDWLCVYSISIDKTVNWQRFINYGKNIYPYRVKATSDGGVLVVGYTYKPANQTPGDNDGDRNSLILKFDENGDLVTKTEEPNQKFVSKPILVLPNPSAGRYEINAGMFQNVEYQIFDFSGRLVIFDKNNPVIDLINQPDGAYNCNFYSNSKFLMSEKLIKQSH
jgi:hypothetical protein